MDITTLLPRLDRERPVLLAGPTASGKSELALKIAAHLGGPVVNADALQVYADWRVLTARPSREAEALWPHALYGHVPGDAAYSVGAWLAELRPYLEGPPPVIVGGTGLYFSALTDGLAAIPPVPPEIAAEAGERERRAGSDVLLADLDAATAARIDRANPRRVRRAWEVLHATGRGLADWQDDRAPPLVPVSRAQPILLLADRERLAPRIAHRTETMLAGGALDEAEANAPGWSPDRPSAKAIGAAELVAHVRGDLTLGEARDAIVIGTRRYAKRQRTWFRARMGAWMRVLCDA